MRQRRTIQIEGTVQGVGFRPYVHGLASRLALGGFVQNRLGGVWIEVEGDAAALDQFTSTLPTGLPPLAQIDRLACHPRDARGEYEFRIEASDGATTGPIFIPPDAATCHACLAELFDVKNRRYRYPFLNCTHCGPRLTIITGAPYDRHRTTLDSFRMCRRCQAEYDDPRDRRFHAQPTACHDCGPQLELCDAAGITMPGSDYVAKFAQAVLAGRIGALKGLGGYHLVCDASCSDAVKKLRERKHRDEKPFAIMVRDAKDAARLCHLSPTEQALLESSARPIVLLRKRASNSSTNQAAVNDVAPKNPYLGVMLPYTPLHHLLLDAIPDRPLVMTSANRSDEPIAHEDREAIERLRGIADLFLRHNRPIQVRCDDSVTRVVAEVELPIRRSRGYAPHPVPLPFACRQSILAVGGQLKATFALGRDRHAFMSHHLGDLDHFEAFRAFERDIELYEKLFQSTPDLIVHDLHPDYASTRYAERRAAGPRSIPRIAVQHHEAHVASCMAEHGLVDPVIGVSFDGTGYGRDGAIWGGEFLVGDYASFERVAHLRYVGLPGGDAAVREPWRMAVAHLLDAGLPADSLAQSTTTRDPAPSATAIKTVQRMLERRFNSPATSSSGRLFDAVAALIGVRNRATFEGQAAMELEWLASEHAPEGTYPFALSGVIIDTRPLVRAIASDVCRGAEPARVARRFHSSVIAIIVAVCERERERTGINSVALSGGVFMNVLLTREATDELRARNFVVYRHRLVPPNDGGISLGQLAVAAHA